MPKLFKDSIICIGPPYGFVHGHLTVDNGIISDIFLGSQLPNDVRISNFEEIVDCSDCVMTPGFINGHIHLNQLLNRARLDGKKTDNLLKSMHGNHYKKTDEDRYWASLLSIAEGIESGTTFFSAFATSTGRIVEAMHTAGVRGCFTIAKKDCWLGDAHKVQTFETDKIIQDLRKTLDSWHFEKVTPMLGFASERSTSQALFEKVGRLSEEYETRIAMHVAEGKDNVEEFTKQRGARPVEYLNRLPLFGPNLTLIHASVLSDKEIQLIAGKGVSVCHCPISNARTGAGLMNYKRMKSLGVNIYFGTDAASTGNTNNLLLEAYCSILLHNSFQGTAESITAEEAMEMMTVNGARALGFENKIGRLEKGFFADFVLWPIHQPIMQPFSSRKFLNLLLFSGGQIKPKSVYIDGKCVYDNFTVHYDVQEAINKILSYVERIGRE